MGSSKKNIFRRIHSRFEQIRFNRLKSKLLWEKRKLDLRADLQKDSHSLIWVWEFSKKAVLICFLFYVVTQVYAMAAMAWSQDFTHLGEFINKAGEIVENCVFAYFVKAGIENVVKIVCSRKRDEENDTDDAVG